jgi:integrase/recombinase XerD
MDHIKRYIEHSKEMQFYSLRDTGITQMLRSGVSAGQVRDQAGHSSLEITNLYTRNSNDNKASDDIKKKCREF